MKKELDNLSHEELVSIAKQYNLYKPETMSKKQLVISILKQNNIEVKEEKDVVHKATTGTKVYTTMFILSIALLVLITFSQFFTSFYFNGKLFRSSSSGNGRYGQSLTIISVLWSLIVFRMWWKTKQFNPWMLMNMVLSIGWFIYFMVNYHSNIKLFEGTYYEYINPYKGYLNTYKALFYVWAAAASFLSISIASLYAIKLLRA